MAKRGRPPNWNKEDIDRIKILFEKYINETTLPIIAEFAYQNNLLRESLYDYPDFSTLLKKCINKKESQLERLGGMELINPTMAIFSLKQLGWRDKQDINVGADIEIKVTIEGLEDDN